MPTARFFVSILLLEPPRCYGSQLTRERWHTKMRRQPGLRIKAQSGARSSTKLKMIKTWDTSGCRM
jgi:hypothetical protein